MNAFDGSVRADEIRADEEENESAKNNRVIKECQALELLMFFYIFNCGWVDDFIVGK